MARLYKSVSVEDRTHALAKVMADSLGLTIPEVISAALIQLDKLKGGQAHVKMAERVKELRYKMTAKADRDGPVQRAERKRHGTQGRRFDHKAWQWAGLAVDGVLFVPEGLHHGARGAANRYRNQNPGWTFTVIRVAGGFNFIRTT